MRADKIIDALTREQADCRNHIKPGNWITFDSFESTVSIGTSFGRCVRVHRQFIVVKRKVVEETVNRWDIQSVNGLPYCYGGRDRRKPRRS
jgi:hypothetical protein